jgi:hypothetical protein
LWKFPGLTELAVPDPMATQFVLSEADLARKPAVKVMNRQIESPPGSRNAGSAHFVRLNFRQPAPQL